MIQAFALAAIVIVLIYALGPWLLAAGVLAAALWAWNRHGSRAGDRTHAANVYEAGLAHRATEQHQAYMAGDLPKGVYGKYPPAV